MKSGADVNALNLRQCTPLHSAADVPDNERVLRLLLDHGADVSARNCEGNTAVHLAVLHGNLAGVQLLLERKADVNALTAYGYTALYLAVGHKRNELAALLLKHGADPDRGQGEVPSHYAVRSRNVAGVELLLKHKANRNVRDGDGLTPLERARRLDYKEIEKLLD